MDVNRQNRFSHGAKPSARHPSKAPHNWLIYRLYDESLERNAQHISGVLYDLGAGKAPYKEWLMQFADKYVSVDWPASYHNAQPDITADLNESLPIASEVADAVILLSVMEHLREPQKMLREVYRILKPGGVLLLQVPWQWWVHEAPHDYFRYTPYGLEFLFQSAGLTDIVIEAQGGVFATLVLKINYLSLRFLKGPRPVRAVLAALLRPLWFLDQTAALVLDRLDRNWMLETPGYFAVAHKPS